MEVRWEKGDLIWGIGFRGEMMYLLREGVGIGWEVVD